MSKICTKFHPQIQIVHFIIMQFVRSMCTSFTFMCWLPVNLSIWLWESDIKSSHPSIHPTMLTFSSFFVYIQTKIALIFLLSSKRQKHRANSCMNSIMDCMIDVLSIRSPSPKCNSLLVWPLWHNRAMTGSWISACQTVKHSQWLLSVMFLCPFCLLIPCWLAVP